METDAHSDREGSSVQEQLERSRRDLEDFFENGAVCLHWVASGGSILRVNQAELDLLGYSREEYVGRHIADFHADGPVQGVSRVRQVAVREPRCTHSTIYMLGLTT